MADAPAPAPPPSVSRSGGLAIAATIVAFGFVGSRLLGIVREAAIANAFGVTPDLDPYFVAFRVPDFIFQVLAGATLGSAFIPVFARLYKNEGAEAAWRLASRVMNLVAVGTAALCVVAFVAAPVLVGLIAPGLGDAIGQPDEQKAEAVRLTRIMLLCPLFFSVSGIMTGILNGRQQFLLPALSPMLYNLAIIFGAVVLADRWGVTGLAIGVVAGSALHMLVQVPGLFREKMRYERTITWADSAVQEVARLMGPRVIGLGAAQVNFFVTIYFASRVGDTAITANNFAWLLAGLPLALFGMALSTAAFPRLAEHAADADLESLTSTISRVLRLIMFLTIPAALGLAILREPATIILFERGEFTREASLVVAGALGWYCLGIVPQAGIEIHSRGFYALGDTKTPVALAVLAVAVNLIIASQLWEDRGIEGLAIAVSIAAWVEWLLLYTLYARRTGSSIVSDFSAIAIMTFCGAMMAILLAVLLPLLDTESWLDNLLVGAAGALGGLSIYAAMSHWLGIEELRQAVERVRAKLGRPA